MENQDRWWTRIRFVLRGWIRIRSISDRIRNPANGDSNAHPFLYYFLLRACQRTHGISDSDFFVELLQGISKGFKTNEMLNYHFLQGVWRNKAVPGGNQTTRTGNININIAMRVYSHSYWLAIFWTNNIGQVLARNNRRKYWKFLE